jgi:hypothetical protein
MSAAPDGQLDFVVTVKAYPAVGVKTGEAVCVAGVTATADPEWCGCPGAVSRSAEGGAVQEVAARHGKGPEATQRPTSAPPTFTVEARPQSDIDAAKAKQNKGQLPLFATANEPIEVLEHSFYYRYRCLDPDCSGHRQSIIDWEIAQAYRRSRREYPTDWEDRLRQKWVDELWADNRDTVVFVW